MKRKEKKRYNKILRQLEKESKEFNEAIATEAAMNVIRNDIADKLQKIYFEMF